jgi:hypothetical protein
MSTRTHQRATERDGEVFLERPERQTHARSLRCDSYEWKHRDRNVAMALPSCCCVHRDTLSRTADRCTCVLTRTSPLANLTPTHPTSLLFGLLSTSWRCAPPIMIIPPRGSRRLPESLCDRRLAYRNRRRLLNTCPQRFSFVSYIPPVDTIWSLSKGVDPGTIWVHILRPDCGLIRR